MKKTLFIGFVFSWIIFSSCKNSLVGYQMEEQESPVYSEEEIMVPEDFRRFYRQFHEDTNYQITHINFPLAGIPANADTLMVGENFKWQEEHWKWHRPLDPALAGYEQRWQVITPEMITEHIIEKTSRIGMTRRFAKMDNEWTLIYYAAMNPMQ